jgi:FtsP/CotA-like multicopper oxidase with cupredoxin domain
MHLLPASSVDTTDASSWVLSTPQHPCGPKVVSLDSTLIYPIELRPQNHLLTATLYMKGDRTVSLHQKMCYVIRVNGPKGPIDVVGAPTFRLKQGDRLEVQLVNDMVEPLHRTTIFPGNGLDVKGATTEAAHDMDSGGSSMGNMDMGDNSGKIVNKDVHHFPCGQRVIEALPTPDPATGRIYGLHAPPFERANLHFHGLNTSPKAPSDDVVNIIVCPEHDKGGVVSSYTYVVDIPRDEPPGLYWYHPHPHGESEFQLLAGLTGAIIVDPLAPSPIDKMKNRTIVLRDLIPFGGGTLRPRFVQRPYQPTIKDVRAHVASLGPNALTEPNVRERVDSPDPFGPPEACATAPPGPPPPPTDSKDITVNTLPVPEDPGVIKYFPTAHIRQGETDFYRVVNTGADTAMDLQLVTDRRVTPLMVVSRDAVPIVTDSAGHPTWQPVPMDHVLLMPGGRVEFYLTGRTRGESMRLRLLAYDTGCFGDVTLTRDILKIDVGAPRPGKGQVFASMPHAVDPVRQRFSDLVDQKPVRHRIFMLSEYNEQAFPQFQDLYITEISNPLAVETPYSMNEPPAVIVKRGTVEDWTILNYTQEVHDFHIHQIHYLVLSHSGIGNGEHLLLDSVIVPYGVYVPGSGGSNTMIPGAVTMRMDFRGQIVGDFVYHCHILEHEDNGMMAKIRVLP